MGGHAGTYLDAHQTAKVARADLAVVIASARPLLLLGELAQPSEQILGIAAERESEPTAAFH